jgi:hypothetical protein
VKTFNIKEFFRFAGFVVGKVLVEKVGVQVAMLRDGRCKPRCPDCRVTLKEVQGGKIAVYDLPLADRNTVWVTLPAVRALPALPDAHHSQAARSPSLPFRHRVDAD